jgi:hypothetical protein
MSPLPSEIIGDPDYDVHAHAERVRSLFRAYPLNNEEAHIRHVTLIFEMALGAYAHPLPDFFIQKAMACIVAILSDEGFHQSEYEPNLSKTLLEKDERIFGDHSLIDAATNQLAGFLVSVVETYCGDSLVDARLVNTLPLIDLVNDPRSCIQHVTAIFDAFKAEDGKPTFENLRHTLFENLIAASGMSMSDFIAAVDAQRSIKVKYPSDRSDLNPRDLAKTYLANTPLLDFFEMPIPFAIPEHIRFEHTHILGGSGHGKSTLLAQQLLGDISQEKPPALIIIDGKGTFVDELRRFALFAPGEPLSDRLVILDPRDIEHPPALNMFASLADRSAAPPHVRLQIQEETINSFSYVFGASDFAMTEKQETCLSYAARVLFGMPEPTLQSLLDLMADPVADPKAGGIRADSPFRPYIDRLAPHHQDFMRGLFYHPTEYTETKRQLRNRIYSLLKHPSFAAMFLTKERRLDLFDIIQNRKILLVNASPAAIGETGAQLLGRYIIAQALTSAYGRLAVPKDQWTPAHLIVDEAQMFIDEDKTQPLLQQAREFNLGVTLAHQKLADLTPKLIATVAANTSIRYVGGVSAADASFMAKNMSCEPEFIMAQRKQGGHTHFATYVRGFTERAVSLSVPLGILDKQPKMTDAQSVSLTARNRAVLASKRAAEPPPVPEPIQTPPEPETPVQRPSSGDTHTGSESGW